MRKLAKNFGRKSVPSQYRNKVYANEPKFTKNIVAGYAAGQLTEYEVTNYIDRVIRSCEKSFPADLNYDGCRRMRPQEVYRYFSQRKIINFSKSGPNNKQKYCNTKRDQNPVKFF